MQEWTQLAIVGVIVAGLVFAFLAYLMRPRRMDERLRPDKGGKPELVFGTVTAALAEQIRVGPQAKPDLANELRAAGFLRPTAMMEFAAVRTVLALVPMMATGVVALLAPPENLNQVLLWGAAVVGVGFSAPRLYVSWRGRVRNQQIERGLPFAIDLLTLSLTAGQHLLAALHEVARELRTTHPDLALDLAIASQQTELHSLEYALKQWTDRVHLPEVANLSLLLIQSERLGTGAAITLIEFANYLRTSMRQRAEAQANRLSFWMLFPSVFCFWIAAAIILIAPAYFEFSQHREKAAANMNQIKTNINRANQNTPPVPKAMSSASSASQ